MSRVDAAFFRETTAKKRLCALEVMMFDGSTCACHFFLWALEKFMAESFAERRHFVVRFFSVVCGCSLSPSLLNLGTAHDFRAPPHAFVVGETRLDSTTDMAGAKLSVSISSKQNF